MAIAHLFPSATDSFGFWNDLKEDDIDNCAGCNACKSIGSRSCFSFSDETVRVSESFVISRTLQNLKREVNLVSHLSIAPPRLRSD